MKIFLAGLLLILLLTSCSPVDSTQPFDQQQAAIVVKKIYGVPASK